MLLVSHSMEDVADYVGRIVVLNHGKVMLDELRRKCFLMSGSWKPHRWQRRRWTYLMTELREKGYPVSGCVTTIAQAKEEIRKLC